MSAPTGATAASPVPVEHVTTSPHRVKVPTVLQQAGVECGAASLGMVLAHFGRWVPLDELRGKCGVTRNGSSALSIVAAAGAYGLDCQGFRGTAADLDGISVPAIIWWRRCHFMVLEGASHGMFHVNDPARGRYSLDAAEFERQYSGAAITFSRTKDFATGGHAYRALPSLARRLRNSATGVRFAIIAGVLAMLLGLVLAPISQVFINDVLGADRSALLGPLIAALLAIGLLRAGLTLLEYGVISRLQAKLTLVGSSAFVDRLTRLPMMFYLERSVGDLSQRVGYNASVASLLATQMASAGIALLGAIGYAALLLYYNWVIGLVVIGLSALNILVLRLVNERRSNAQARAIRRQNELRGTTTSSIRTIETIKSTGMEDDVFTSLTGQQAEYISAQAALVPTSALLVSTPVLLFSLTSATILVLGGWFTIAGTFTLGALLAMQALAANLNSPLQTLMSTASQLQVITSSLQSLDDVLANEPDARFDVPDLAPDDAVEQLSGRLEFRGVSFRYGENAPDVIEGFDLDLPPGRRVALVGGSGSGKTTIANLAAGLYRPDQGAVLYDGRELTDYPRGVVAQSVSKVDQSIVLFAGTVRENVTLWDPTISEADVASALDDAQILRDVLARQGGIDCAVEENGRNFSGGQCQRLEIARALARSPRLLILDEATSALDDVTEKKVDDALRARGIACLIVAHRLSTIRDADEIVVLGRGGTVVERGTHAELMGLDGEYVRMVSMAGEGGDVGS